MFTIYQQKTVFINGVTVEDLTTKKNKELDNSPEIKSTPLQLKLPVIFTSVENWPKKTSLRCWWCHLSFNTMPLFIPQSIEPMPDGSRSIGTHGCFHTFNCAQAYINKNIKTLRNRANVTGMLKLLYLIITGKKIDKIDEAPNPLKMQQYIGGPLTPELYNKLITDINNKNETDFVQPDFAILLQLQAVD